MNRIVVKYYFLPMYVFILCYKDFIGRYLINSLMILSISIIQLFQYVPTSQKTCGISNIIVTYMRIVLYSQDLLEEGQIIREIGHLQ